MTAPRSADAMDGFHPAVTAWFRGAFAGPTEAQRQAWPPIRGLGQAGEQMGQVNVRDPHRFGFGKNGAHKLASYIAKYCAKQMDCRELDQKRYFRSRGIVLPLVNTWRLGSTDMLLAVQVAFAVAAEYGLEGVQTWCNNGLGVGSWQPGRSAGHRARLSGWRRPAGLDGQTGVR